MLIHNCKDRAVKVIMDSDKSLIDSLLKLDVSGARSAGHESSNRDDTRSDRGNDFTEDAPRFRRISDPHQPPGDTMKFTIMPPGVAGIDNKSDNDRDYVRSPPRYNAENGGEYVPDAFAMGAVARFREVDDPKGIGGYSSSIAGEAVHMTRSSTQSRVGTCSSYSTSIFRSFVDKFLFILFTGWKWRCIPL